MTVLLMMAGEIGGGLVEWGGNLSIPGRLLQFLPGGNHVEPG